MKLNKEYRINPKMMEIWKGMSTGNARMAKMIDSHGGSFFPILETLCDGERFISSVEFKDKTQAGADGEYDEYFEISEHEFQCFEEVVSEGVTRLDVIVTHNNVDEMIELIKNTFKK